MDQGLPATSIDHSILSSPLASRWSPRWGVAHPCARGARKKWPPHAPFPPPPRPPRPPLAPASKAETSAIYAGKEQLHHIPCECTAPNHIPTYQTPRGCGYNGAIPQAQRWPPVQVLYINTIDACTAKIGQEDTIFTQYIDQEETSSRLILFSAPRLPRSQRPCGRIPTSNALADPPPAISQPSPAPRSSTPPNHPAAPPNHPEACTHRHINLRKGEQRHEDILGTEGRKNVRHQRWAWSLQRVRRLTPTLIQHGLL